ncbi:MAG: DUF3578 domain-containing protein [Calditrichaeota bacterium]|nr:DUF3578 domain-containing protein [Calditrichota bacterium]
MSLSATLTLLLEEYLKESEQPFAGNVLADLIREEAPRAFVEVIDNNDRYEVKGSVGQGNWAKVPWIAIFDRFVTESAQDGYYIVYLFREDCSGVYLSLNQGVTSVRQKYKSEAKDALKIRASDFQSQLGTLGTQLVVGPIDLAVTTGTSLGAFYEAGSICAKFYARDAIPTDDILAEDIRVFLDLYNGLAERELISPFGVSDELDEASYEDVEDLTLLRLHKRYERNKRLASKVKKIHGYTCQICGFSFSRAYVEIGDEFIEAHHLIPLSQLKGQRVALDPRKDFAVLCSNCHRMIHKTKLTSDIESFREEYLKSGQRRLNLSS